MEFTESAYKSLALKSLRLGWPEGIRIAEQHLSRSTLRRMLLMGTFEDVFPPESELPDVLDEVERHDYEALCSRETHHGRGYTEEWCTFTEWPEPSTWLPAAGRRLGLYLPEFWAGNVWAWLAMTPADQGIRRAIDAEPWTDMPAAMLDGHTTEGHRRRTLETILSGSYGGHRRLGRLVELEGWHGVRGRVHGT